MDIVFFVGKKHIDPLNVDFEFEKYLSILLINEVYLTPQKIVGINLINLLKKTQLCILFLCTDSGSFFFLIQVL